MTQDLNVYILMYLFRNIGRKYSKSEYDIEAYGPVSWQSYGEIMSLEVTVSQKLQTTGLWLNTSRKESIRNSS
jgi:hypothetical protein